MNTNSLLLLTATTVIALPLLAAALIVRTATELLFMSVAVPKGLFEAIRSSDREFTESWLAELEPYQRAWLERHNRVEDYTNRADFHLRQNLNMKRRGVEIAAIAFEDVSINASNHGGNYDFIQQKRSR